MKKAIIAIVIFAVVAAAAAGGYFIFSGNDEPKEAVSLSITKDDFTETFSRIEAYIKNPDRYEAALASDYEMGNEKAAEFYAAPENWLAYEQILVVKNVGDTDVTVYGFEVKDNGKDGVYISTASGGEIGISPGGSATTSFSVLCSDGELSTDEVKAIVDSMEVSVVYTKTPEEYDNGEESTEETKLAVIEEATTAK